MICVASNRGFKAQQITHFPTVTADFIVICMQIYYLSTYTQSKPKN